MTLDQANAVAATILLRRVGETQNITFIRKNGSVRVIVNDIEYDEFAHPIPRRPKRKA